MAIRIKRPRIGITLRFFLLFASVGLIPIGFMSFYAFWQINRQVAFEVENNLTNVGLRFRDDVSRTIDEATRIDDSIAADPVFSDGRARRADIEREMELLRDESPEIRGLYLLKGREVLSSSGPRAFVSGDPGILDFSTAAPYVSAPRPFPDNVNPAFLVSVPVKTGAGGMPTVLVAAVDARALMDAARLVRIGETGRAYVIDDSGNVVAGPDAAGLFMPFADEAVTRRIATVGEGIIHYTVHNTDGPDLRHIAFVASVPERERPLPRGLRVLVTYGEDEAYLVADQIGDSIGVALIMILAATSLFSFLLSRTITRPIREISRGTERIRAGDFSREITVRSRDEIGELARSFNRMAGELSISREFMENYNRELERQVQERSQKLEDSERKYRMVVEGSGDGWTILGEDLSILFANDTLARMLGVRPTKLARTNLSEFLSRGEEVRVREAVARVIGRAGSVRALTFEAEGAGERRIVFSGTFSAMPADTDGRVIAHLVDQTGLVELEAQKERLQLELMERSKHSQIGIMTEGLFHNLNNPLQGLLGLLRVIQQDIGRTLGGRDAPGDAQIEASGQIVRDVDETYAIARRLSDQVKNLLMKIRKESRRKVEDLDLNAIVRAEVAFLEADLFFKHKVEKRLSLADRLPLLPGVYSDISQSFVNIILNATDAMRESAERRLTITTALEKKRIAVTFHDTGSGIDEASLPHIFDPFFTTKYEKEQGTGLGLYTVDFLLKPYRVGYRVTSRPGDTSISLLFPTKGLGRKKEKAGAETALAEETAG